MSRVSIAVLFSIAFQISFAQSVGRQIPKELTDGVQIETHSKYYNQAYLEIAEMLDGKSELSIKRAVFLLEWAYLDGKLDYADYCAQIDTTAKHIKLFIAANRLDQYKTGGNFALFEYFSRPYSMNDHKPFTYDFEDFAGSEDLTKLFVTKVMRTHTGQCRSLPMYYKVLAEAIGAESYITLAPQHLFIRHRDEQNPSKWINVELTTQSLSREIFYIENFGISDEAIRNKLYMYPLTDKETIAYLLSELADGYVRKFKDWDDFVWLCSIKGIEHYPQNVGAMMHKGNVLNMRLKGYMEQHDNKVDDYARLLDQKWLENRDAIRKLGWTEMSDSTYEGLLKGVEEQMKQEGVSSDEVEKTINQTKESDKKDNPTEKN